MFGQFGFDAYEVLLFYYMAMQSRTFFPIPSHLLLQIHATFSRVGGKRLLWQTGWLHYAISSPRLLKDIFIRILRVEIILCSTQYVKVPGKDFVRGHTLEPVCHWPPGGGHPTLLPPWDLAIGFLTLSSKCLCFNRHNFQLSPCTLEVTLLHPEQIPHFFFSFICSSELAAE